MNPHDNESDWSAYLPGVRVLQLMACTLVCTAIAGCSWVTPHELEHATGPTQETPRWSITYRTESDRINTAGAGLVQPASYGQPAVDRLPNVTICALNLTYPHPKGIKDTALATVRVRPLDSHSLIDTDVGEPPWFETMVLDVPQWQAAGIMSKLEQQNFFRRAKVLDANAFVSVTAKGQTFAKKFRAVPELDALILLVRQRGRVVSPGPISATNSPPDRLSPPADDFRITRLPPLEGA